MGKRLLFTLFAILFCSTMFGQNFTPKYEYQPDGTYTEPMTLLAKISFDGAVQNNANLELGVFSNDELRGGCFLMDVFGTGDYLAMTSVFGERGQYFTFKVYDHTPGVETEREWNVSCTFINGDEGMEYMSYNAEGFVDPINPAVINFVTPNHWTPNHTDYQFNFNVIAVVMKDGVEQTDTNLELGAFDANGKVRGSVKLQPQTLLGNTRYYADMLVYGTKGDEITFKLYDHGTGQEFPFNEVNSCVLTEDKDASGNPILGSYLNPLEVNFITAPYVAQIGNNKYLSFDAALEAAEDGDNIELLKSIDLGTTTAVIEESINITLGEYAITGTVELANISATITGAQNGVTSVTTNVEGYKVVYEDGKYKLVAKVYVAQVGDVKYESIQEAVANWTNNTTLTLLADVTLSDVITLKSTEHHILNLSTYTMTAAAGKNAIEITCNAQSSETYALTVKANSETPGGIIAVNKSCIYYKKSDETKDRPIITIENGVFNGGYSINIYSSNRGTNCPTVKIANGTFNGNVNIAHGKLITTGGIFNGWIYCTGDVTAYRLISGGTFKNWQFMTEGPSGVEYKFTVGKMKNVFDCGVYVDDNGYLVVGGDVITEAGTRFKASSNTTINEYTSPYNNYYYYLKYSSAKDNGIYYTSVEKALADNKKENSEVNIYVSELVLTGTSYKGTLVITEDLTVTFPEGTTPAWTVASGVNGHQVGYTESVENGVVTRVYTLFTPVAQVGEVKYESLDAAFAAAQEGETITMLDNVTEVFDIDNMANVTFDMNGFTLTGAIKPSKANVTIKKGTIINENSGVSAIEINEGSLVLNNDVVIKSARHALRIDGNVAVTINGGEYKAAIGNGTGTYHALNVSGTAVVTIVDGTFVGPKGTSADSGAAVNVQTGATVSISGGNFSGGKNNTLVSKGVLTLTGGTYDQDVNAFCADGYAAITNDNATWTVIEALTRNLEEGWNWFSSYVVADAEDVQEALGENGLQIKSQLGFSQYIEYNGMKFWDGTITENPSVGMYMIKTSQAHEMTLVGNHVDPSQTPITIHPDWTWIAYPMTVETNISDAIDFTPEVGDQIKGRNGFAYYFGEHTGWGGEINTLVPGHGYMYHSIAEDTKTLKYSYPQAGSRSALKTNVTSENNHWVADAYKYANNMTMLATVDVEGGDYEVAAFVNGEVRGSSRPIYVESLDTYMLFLTIHGDEVEEMTFKMYDLTTGEEYAFDNRMNYSSDAIVGSIEEPYMLTCSTLGIGETSLSEINIYPNPTTIGREINLGTECEMVEVFNTLGAKVAEYQNVDRIDAFETAGVYVIRVTDNNEVKHCRLVVK